MTACICVVKLRKNRPGGRLDPGNAGLIRRIFCRRSICAIDEHERKIMRWADSNSCGRLPVCVPPARPAIYWYVLGQFVTPIVALCGEAATPLRGPQ